MTVVARPTEFDCQDCGDHVVAFHDAGLGERCATCCWIREDVVAEYHRAVRKRLGVPVRSAGA
jgi:hypothetical protein